MCSVALFAQMRKQVDFVFALRNQICSFRPLEASRALTQLCVVPLWTVLLLARVKIGEPVDFSVGSNVNYVNFPVDLGVLNPRGSVGSPVFAAPLELAMFLEDVGTILSCSIMSGSARSLREVPPHLLFGAHRKDTLSHNGYGLSLFTLLHICFPSHKTVVRS